MPIVVGPGIVLGAGVSLTTPDNALGSVAVDNTVDNHVENQGITSNVGGELYSREFLLW